MTLLCNTHFVSLRPEIKRDFMETIYLGIVIFLFVLAIFDLIVGVSNDAVNFLNSAVGAKAASFKTVLFIAAGDADRRGVARCIQFNGYAYLYHRFHGVRAVGRYVCFGADKDL